MSAEDVAAINEHTDVKMAQLSTQLDQAVQVVVGRTNSRYSTATLSADGRGGTVPITLAGEVESKLAALREQITALVITSVEPATTGADGDFVVSGTLHLESEPA